MPDKPKNRLLGSRLAQAITLASALLVGPQKLEIDVRDEKKRETSAGNYTDIKTEVDLPTPALEEIQSSPETKHGYGFSSKK